MQTVERSTRREIVNDLVARRTWRLARGLEALVDGVARIQGGALVELSLRAAGDPGNAALRAGVLRNFGVAIAALVSSAPPASRAGEASLDRPGEAVRRGTSPMESVGIAGESSLARTRSARGRVR